MCTLRVGIRVTDDIVTRLRRHADAGVPSYTKQLDTEAADEIEHLRQQLTDLRWDNNRLSDLYNSLYEALKASHNV